MIKPLNRIQAYNLKKQFKGSKKLFNYFLAFVDVLFSILTFYLSFLIVKNLGNPYLVFSNEYIILSVLLIPTLTILLQATNLARVPRTSRYLSIFFDFARFSIPFSILIFIYIYVLKLEDISLKAVLLYIPLNISVLCIIRIITFSFFKFYRSTGHNTNFVLLIADETSIPIIDKIIDRKEWGFKILFILSNSNIIREKYGHLFKIFPDKVGFKNLIDVDIVDEVIYCKKSIEKEKLETFVKTCEETGVVFRMQNDLSTISYKDSDLCYFEEIPMLTFMNTPSNQIGLIWKTVSESVISFLTLLMLSSVMFLVAILIKLESRGPVIFKQKRVGLRGRQFYIYKFRTMISNAEQLKESLANQNESDGPMFKIRKDPRITKGIIHFVSVLSFCKDKSLLRIGIIYFISPKIGRILRKLSIDELPQLFNVLKGEMSLIGPRPPLPNEVEQFERWQLKKLSVKPGITCTWQIIPNRNDVLFEKWMKLDIQYIENWSLKNDFILFFKTIKSIISSGGGV